MRIFILLITILFALACLADDKTAKVNNTIAKILASASTKYVCQLCPHVENIYNSEVYDHDGQCPICKMNLIELHKRSLTTEIALHSGSGNYFIAGGKGKSDKLINVFYHKPKNFNSTSRILIVVPGAGRNAWNYRDSWVEASEKYNVLILSPAYAKADYDFGAYHLGGTVSNFIFDNKFSMSEGRKSGKYRFKDEELVFTINNNNDTWIFNDFDRIFDNTIESLATGQTSYDIFGHSAGGQILHRLVVFMPLTKANRILASNSGSYTIPNYEDGLPFGLRDSSITEEQLHNSFASRLVLFIGELDNEEETSGSLLHTPTVDKQGLGRLSRSRYFFEKSAYKASEVNATFNWERKVIAGVGHDYKNMGKAAAVYLYAE